MSNTYVLYLYATFFFQFVESQFTLRTDERHSYHCGVLDRQDLSSADKQHFSLVYGVNRRALLLSYFSVASGALIPDIMHDVLEGALPLEVKLMPKVLTCSVNVHAIHVCVFLHRYL